MRLAQPKVLVRANNIVHKKDQFHEWVFPHVTGGNCTLRCFVSVPEPGPWFVSPIPNHVG